ncbi:DUF4382 domain-containing protein [Photobacterium sp. ZSDE20]|uniref:DUF4382 domain-containing protein n=1 Tax=Photobacterium pectinilyticum TaxID=2906793 RepID=A0ABT1N9H7_9GAMM|nr:DUF4382 domain-containing protein [Photobacterium sp. ZSDE20]MCQ1061378.1 DUF4382 domain-containing protein [Photobacterium sp. ZSDE20]MDD1830114.1 DUF4382 domain-containing protein [Photobacterium sp. ZSDE20]
MKYFSVIAVLSLAITGCGSDSTEQQKTALVSFSVSDAPVDDASEVVVAFDALELKHQNGESFYLNVVDTDETKDYQQVDLLDYRGTDARLILSDQRIPLGEYKELIVHTKAGSLNWVTNNGMHDLKIPSNKLRLGGFEVTTETVQAFTIEFDLRKSLVLRGNAGNNNGYNLKPHGVTIVDNSAAASIKGSVDPALFSSGEACSEDGGNFVYLYEGHHSNGIATLVDNIDVDDQDYNDDLELPTNYVSPYASTGIYPDGSYAFGFVPSGEYTIAFTCSAYIDDPIQYDQILIANPSEQIADIVLSPTQEYIHNFE